MNELIEQIKRDAVTIQRFSEAELQTRQILKAALGPAYKEVETTHDAIDRIMTRNAQTEAAMFNDSAKRLDAASTRIHELEEKLKTAETRIAELLCEPEQAVRTLRDLESTANDNGRKPDEAVREFLTRTVSELMTAEGKVRRIQKHAIICNAKQDESVIDFMSRMKDTNAQLKQQLAEADSAADKNGCHATEETAEFINRIAAELKTAKSAIREKDSEIGKLISLSNERAQEITTLKESHSATSDGLSRLQIENLKRQLQTAKDDLERQHLRETKISAEYQADIKKILATANKLGRADYESPESFMNRQAADMESQKRELYLVRQESDNKTQKVLELSRWHEENLEKIKGLEADLANSRSQESPEATRNALRNVTADRDRIRTELAAIIAEANKSGRCNGDPVQLLKQGQADLDALTHFEKDNAKLDALVSKLQGELAEARAQQQKSDTADMKAQLRDAKQDYEIVRVQLDRIAKTAKRCGRTDKESVIDFMNRQQSEKGQMHSQCKQACEQLERIQKAANETHRCGLDPVALIRKGQFDHMKIVEFRKEVVRIQAEHDALVSTHSAKEVDRLSALVATLQVELDDAKRKYGDIMAALGNETPLDAVYRLLGWPIKEGTMQTPSTIPHDERAKLVGEIADLRKRLDEKQKEHAKLHYDFGSVSNCARNHGLRKDEDLKVFITRKCNELAGALNFGERMQDMANERGQKLDAALATVANQSAAIAEAQRVTEKYTAACKAATKLKEWASTVRHKVMVKVVHDKAMQEYDNIIKELDGEAAK